MDNSVSDLRTDASRICGKDGRTVILRGACLGGWMNMENFIIGFPANEEAMRVAVRQVLGNKASDFFFDRFLHYFFTDDDATFLASLGLNLLRITVNYRHFEDDLRPFVIKEEGFAHLDRVITLCSRHGIYTIIDLHALPGYQNQDWHCDNPTHKAFFWQHKHFQDRAVRLWEAIADHYKGNPWVAGYDPINEPADPSEAVVEPVYRRLVEAIRAIDPNHILFIEGNRYSGDFHMFKERWPNVVYAVHDYPPPGAIDGGRYPGLTRGMHFDAETLERSFELRCRFMIENQLPIWVGEFGPVYLGDSGADEMRYRLLRDQLAIYARHQVNWSIWTYKDIGVQGLVYVAPNSAWLRRIHPIVEKKARLAVDTWASNDTPIRRLLEPLEQAYAAEFPAYNPFPFGAQFPISRLVRGILLAEPLLQEFGDSFQNLNDSEIDGLMQSFLLGNCIQRQELAAILAHHASGPDGPTASPLSSV